MKENGGLRRSGRRWHILSCVAAFVLVSVCTSVFRVCTHSGCIPGRQLAQPGAIALQSSRHDVAGGQGAALYLPFNTQQAAPAREVGYSNNTVHPVCKFLATSQVNPTSEERWGNYGLCLGQNSTVWPIKWMRKVGTNCYRCNDSANICQKPPKIIYHQYLNHLHPKAWQGNLLSFQAYLMTQDLKHTEMWLWADDISKLYDDRTKPFFDSFRGKIKFKTFDHGKMVKGTVWEKDPFLGNGALVRRYMKAAGAYSDIVRLLILWHHGGFWMDNDVIFLRDLYPLLSVSYQFIMRWTNGHCMLMFKGSRLLYTLMDQARGIALNRPHFERDVINKTCKAVNYSQASPEEYGYTDVYNTCLFRLIRVHHNNGPPGDRLYEFPLGWFDQEWVGCQRWKKSVTDGRWRWIARHYLALHTRYPKRLGLLPENGTYLRAKRLIEEYFRFCSYADCVPTRGADLLEFEGLGEAVVAR